MTQSNEQQPGRPPLEAMEDIRLDKVLAAKRNILKEAYDDPAVLDQAAEQLLDTVKPDE